MSTMVYSSPASSPSPTPPLNQTVASSPHHHNSQSLSTKAGALLASAKSTLSEQSSRLALKHNTDLDLLDDLRMYLKNRCSIERDYSQAMIKLNQTYSKKSSPLLTYIYSEDDIADVKTVYSSWKIYQEEMEKQAKNRLSQFEQLSMICEQLKTLRNHKIQITKKCLDTHLKKMQEEILNSVSEIDKTRKLYFEEEHLAKQARDKEEKIKKRKTGIFSSFASLQNRKERTSAHREASDIQSTQARNEYILALAAGNAHLTHYHEQDLVNLMMSIDDCVLDKCRGFMVNLLQVEQDTINSWGEVALKCMNYLQATSADYTNSVFLKDPNSAAINETLLYEFQPCDNDPLDSVSLEHNADIALRNEGQKWFQWFSKECRNLNRLSAQLIKLQTLQSEGHKTVDVPGSGSVDLENKIDELRHQLRKSEISKMKAKARLQIIQESGAEVEDFEAFEAQVINEAKQQSLDVDLTIGNLSRTSSVRSNIGLSETKSPTLNKSDSEAATFSHPRPESSSSVEQLDSPDREVLQMGSSMECTSPAPTGFINSSDVNASLDWNTSAYDPTQAWDDDSASTLQQTNNHNGHEEVDHGDIGGTIEGQQNMHEVHHGEYEHHYDQYHHEVTVDAYTLVGKQCYALYAYESQTEDDLTFAEQDILTVLEANDKDWVQAQDMHGNVGYVPAAYLQAMPEQPESSVTHETYYESTIITTEQVVTITESHSNESEVSKKQNFDAPAENEVEQHEPGVQYATAIYDYVATSAEEISFKAGETIRILENFSDDGWWTGKNEAGDVGHFPSMLVHGPDEHDVDEDDGDESDDEAEDDDEEEDSSSAHPTFAPPNIALPTVAPPVLISQNDSEDSLPLPPIPPPPPSSEMVIENGTNASSLPPTFAPPPKPMTLMAPQTVVIIQPTPEIENRPIVDDDLSSEMDVNINSDRVKEDEVSIALAIAAHEIATDITQQALDDSMAEISRRASLENTPEMSLAQQPEKVIEDTVETVSEEMPPPPSPPVLETENVNPVQQKNDNEDEEDCK